MIFQIPMAETTTYLVFIVARDDTVSTAFVGFGAVVGATIGVAFTLFFYTFDAGEPALRLPLIAFSTALGMYASRAGKLGPLAFLGGYILAMSQTLIDNVSNTDRLVHGVLWLWVVVTLPVAVTVAAQLLTGEGPRPGRGGRRCRCFAISPIRCVSPS
jgi:multidrug resistance protein MdtO